MKSRFMTCGRQSAQSGFTLMENLVVVGVMTVTLVLLVEIFMVSYSSFAKQTARAENDSSAILTARVISEYARGASEVLASQTINGTAYTSSDDSLVLKLPTVSPTGETLAAHFDYVAFYRDTTNTDEIHSDIEADDGSYRQDGNRLVSDNNAALVFRYDNPDVTQSQRVSVYLRNERAVRGTTVKTEAWTSIFLRNR